MTKNITWSYDNSQWSCIRSWKKLKDDAENNDHDIKSSKSTKSFRFKVGIDKRLEIGNRIDKSSA